LGTVSRIRGGVAGPAEDPAVLSREALHGFAENWGQYREMGVAAGAVDCWPGRLTGTGASRNDTVTRQSTDEETSPVPVAASEERPWFVEELRATVLRQNWGQYREMAPTRSRTAAPVPVPATDPETPNQDVAQESLRCLPLHERQ